MDGNGSPVHADLGRDDVHVWRATLTGIDPARFEPTLSADEQERAARFRFARDRHRYVVTRGVLRALLGRYLNQAPERLRFCYGRRGKPALAAANGGTELRFNVSHADDLALVAITRERDVGVDVERVREHFEIEPLIESCCSPPEIAALGACRPQARRAAFFATWTSKEAYLKGIGDGLHFPPERLTVRFATDGRPPELMVDGTRVEDWTLRTLDLERPYAAAVAAEGGDFLLSLADWRRV